MDSLIKVEHLSKRYFIGKDRSGEGLRHKLDFWVKAPFRKQSNGKAGKSAEGEEFWALNDISFDVKQGEVIGVIGRNGAGKSTLLKVLSRITEPTKGRITITGRVASLLEVGTGFHPELTGRENIFLNGAILGMSRREIKAKFDEIVAFAEIDRFIDTPVKRYSSGMYVRLAFAVAAHLEPEILIVDEVLAVGDAEFQKKCLGKMREVSGKGGRTVLFVSHNMNAIATLTARCILLEHGLLRSSGKTEDVIRDYLESGHQKQTVYRADPVLERPSITRAEVITSADNAIQHHAAPLIFEFDIHMPEGQHGKTFSFQILDSMERPVVHLWQYDQERPMLRTSGTHTLQCEIPCCRLNVGKYTVRAFLGGAPGQPVDEIAENLCDFEVVIHGRPTLFGWRPETCAYLEDAVWKV